MVSISRVRPGATWAVLALAIGRPLLFGLIATSVAIVAILAVDLDPFGNLFRYVLEVQIMTAVGVGALATWWAVRSRSTWDADLIPALVGATGVFILFGMLHGTPWGPGGIAGDAAFRTEAVTRFADTWGTADFTYRGLPAFYAPAYFWILGRAADIIGVEPWRMIKYGTVLFAMVVPIVTYLLWRRIVTLRVAALMAVLTIAVQTPYFYETYAWIVAFAIVPWWILVVHGVHREDISPPHPIVLGIVGGLLFMTYYYFFLAAALALGIQAVVVIVRGEPLFPAFKTPALTFLITAAVSSVFWVPLGLSALSVDQVESLANRWFAESHGIPQLPFVQVTPIGVGVFTLIGLFYLVLTAREPLSRALLVLLGGIGLWYLVGLVGALMDVPLLTFRSKPLVPIILMVGGVLAFARIASLARRRLAGQHRTHATVAVALASVILTYIAARSFMLAVTGSDLISAAHATSLPSGALTHFAPEESVPDEAPTDAIAETIDSSWHDSRDHPTILSTRPDVLALHPYYGFSQWQVYYAHPAAEFHDRIEFLRELASSADPDEFADLSATNRFEPIHAFVLQSSEETLDFLYRDDNFPERTVPGVIAFPRSLFDSSAFELTTFGEYTVAVRR